MIAPTASKRRSPAFKSKYSGAATAVSQGGLRVFIPDHLGSIGIAIRPRAPEDCLEHAEDRGVGADGEGHREYRDHGEERVGGGSDGELGVHLEFLSKFGAAHVGLHVRANDAAFVANAIDVSKPRTGCCRGVSRSFQPP